MAHVRRLTEAIVKIHAAPHLETFSREVFQAIGELIPDVFLSLDQLNVKTGEVSHAGNMVLTSDILAKVIELMPSHPVMPAAVAGLRGAIRVTDCITQRQFRQTPHYNEYMKVLGVAYQTVITLDIPGQIAGITVNRENDFTDEEATFLTLLAPHLAMASSKLKSLDTLQRTLDSVPFPTPYELQKIGLTRRESEILFWVMQGKRDSEIAEILSEKAKVSIRTINNHLRNILAKMNAETRTGASINALERIKQNLSDGPCPSVFRGKGNF
jgi:DNA-binding CsgD family transcriptional regulator